MLYEREPREVYATFLNDRVGGRARLVRLNVARLYDLTLPEAAPA